MSPQALQRRRNFIKNQAGRIALANAPATTPPEDDDAPACRNCGDTQVDRFGFDCTDCL